MTRRNTNDLEKPDIEGKLYDPEGYEGLASLRMISGVVFVVGLLIVLAIMASIDLDESMAPGFAAFIFFFAVMGIIGFVYNVQLEEHKEKVFLKKNEKNEKLHKAAEVAEALLKDANVKLEKQMELTESLQKANTIGDIIITNAHAPIIISSTIRNSFNTITVNDPDLASIIKVLGGFIENSENSEAAKYFDQLHQQIAQEERNPTLIKALWNGIVNALPAVKDLTEVVEKITRLFV